MHPSDVIRSLFPMGVNPEIDISNLKSPELTVPAKVFIGNCSDVKNMLMLPLRMSGTAVMYGLDQLLSVQALLEVSKDRTAVSALETPEYKEARKKLRLDAISADSGEKVALDIDRTLVEQMNDPTVASAVGSLRLSSLVLLWTAFECLAHDVWVNVLNDHPQKFWNGVVSSVDGKEGKQISLQLLAKHQFSLKHSLGNVLARKHDFSCIEGLERAYSGLLGRDNPCINELARLKSLCAARNLIVHRRGIVDERFKSLTNTQTEVGELVVLTGEQILNFFEEVASAASVLLHCVDEAIQA